MKQKKNTQYYAELMKKRFLRFEETYNNGGENPVLVAQHEQLWGKSGEMVRDINVDSLDYLKCKDGENVSKLNPQYIVQLKESIERVGIIEPLIIRPLYAGYQVVMGNHRLAAARELGLKTVRCIVRDMTDEEAIDFYMAGIFSKMR